MLQDLRQLSTIFWVTTMRVSTKEKIRSPGATSRMDFVEGIPRAIGVALGRPEVASLDLLAGCLVLVDPPILHSGTGRTSDQIIIRAKYDLGHLHAGLDGFAARFDAAITEAKRPAGASCTEPSDPAGPIETLKVTSTSRVIRQVDIPISWGERP